MNHTEERIQLETHPTAKKKPTENQKGGDGEGEGYFFSWNSCLIRVIVQQLKHASRTQVFLTSLTASLMPYLEKGEEKI